MRCLHAYAERASQDVAMKAWHRERALHIRLPRSFFRHAAQVLLKVAKLYWFPPLRRCAQPLFGIMFPRAHPEITCG